MKTEICIITPEKALALLQQNKHNRPLNQAHVAFFESQLRNGEMQLTHQGIAISKTGILLDGQHRCTAIVSTGIAATMMVVSDLPDEVFSVLDSGIKRTAKDVIALEGGQNTSAITPGIRLFLLYRDYPSYVWTGKIANINITTPTLQKTFNLDAENWQWAARAAKACHSVRFAIPGPITCLFYLAYTLEGYSRTYLEHFGAQLKDGANLSPGDPILAYRNRMINVTGQRGQERLADYIKLFNAYVTGQRLKIFKNQQFPPMPTIVHASESIHNNAEA
jgi:hypothetical protein